MDQKKIGEYIAKCRKEKNLTQKELADKLGVSDKSISKWENAKCMPDLSLFTPLCEILGITVNDLMSGAKVDNQDYINTLEENMVNMMANIEVQNHKRKKKWLILFIFIIIIVWAGYVFYFNYEMNVPYNSTTMKCQIEDSNLNFNITGLSVINTNYATRKIGSKTVYFFRTTIYIMNKRRSHFEYSYSMDQLLENKEVTFGSSYKIELGNDNVDVYHTNYSMKAIEKANEEKLKKIIEKSHLMCSTE